MTTNTTEAQSTESAAAKIIKRNRARQLEDVQKSLRREEDARKAGKGVKKGTKGAKSAPKKGSKGNKSKPVTKNKIVAGLEEAVEYAQQEPKAKPEKAPKLTAAEKAAKEVSEAPDSTVRLSSNLAPSVEIVGELQQAFDHFNAALFQGKLEPVVFSNSRLKKAHGFFWAKQWNRRSELVGKVHEIGLDFARIHNDFGGKKDGDKQVMGTLVHEMCHLLVEQMGKSPPKPYHCKYWVAAMNMVGLEPVIISSKGEISEKATGPNATHNIVEGSHFDKAADELLATGFKFSWFNVPLPDKAKAPAKKKKAGAKAKHECPTCAGSMWGRPSAVLHCHGNFEDRHEPVEMVVDRAQYEGDEAEGDAGNAD